MSVVDFAVIGGSGLYSMEDLMVIDRRELDTPFGKPSAPVMIGQLGDRTVAFLPRHGLGHERNPSCVNVRANIWALKSLGVESILSVSAVGSLQEAMAPRDIVVPDQIIDRTKSRGNTFFDPIAVHVGFADPFCARLSALVEQAASSTGVKVHRGGTYVCMEGPLFSTRAESDLYRSWGASIIGMTALPEAKLAREAEMCYATMALVTDYDCWHDSGDVTIELVLENMRANTQHACAAIRWLASHWEQDAGACSCHRALENALLTRLEDIPDECKSGFRLLLGKYHQF
jgi:5'-methylthioadenosine phosphorylase